MQQGFSQHRHKFTARFAIARHQLEGFPVNNELIFARHLATVWDCVTQYAYFPASAEQRFKIDGHLSGDFTAPRVDRLEKLTHLSPQYARRRRFRLPDRLHAGAAPGFNDYPQIYCGLNHI